MLQDTVKTCRRCGKKDITNFSTCKFCNTKYDTTLDTKKPPKSRLGKIIILVLLTALALYGADSLFRSLYFHRTAAEQTDLPANLPSLLLPPVQVALSPSQVTVLKGYTITKLASYTVTARILTTSYNWPDPLNDLSPVDLGLGWGFMADKRVIGQILIFNGGRWLYWFPPEELYRYYPNKQLIKSAQIYSCSSNHHIIPANDQIRKIIESLHRDQVVTLTGSLINVTKPNGMYWNTSLSRDDIGSGGCEIMYVENVQIH